MKRILVTGGAGFIGSYVIKELLAKNYHICLLDNLSKNAPRQKKNKNIEFAQVDLADKIKARKYFKKYDMCIHLAAKIGGIGYFHKYPATILNENNKIYTTVFELAAEFAYKRLLYASSSMVFESTENFPSKETDLQSIPPPFSAYGFSKLIGEMYCRAFWDEYKLPFTIIRPFNAYGINEVPGDEVGYSHVIPDLIKKIHDDQYPVEILGDGNQTRCFTHASDIARGIVMALESTKARNSDFNIGISKETKIIDLARLIYKLSGKKKVFRYKSVSDFHYDIKRRVPDVTKAKNILGWEPKITLDNSLPEIIKWVIDQLRY